MTTSVKIKRFRLVVVDDNHADLHVMKEAMTATAAEIELVEFDNAVTALDYLRAGNETDMLITDLNMPKMTGADLLLEIVGTPNLCGMALALTSSCREADLPTQVRNLPGLTYLRKASDWQDWQRLARQVYVSLVARDDGSGPSKGKASVVQRMSTPPATLPQ